MANESISTIRPEARAITFNVNSTPNGAAIYVNGEDTGFTTPYSLQYTEGELSVGNKIITLVNGAEKSTETYILSSQIQSSISSVGDGTIVQTGGSSGGGGGGSSSRISDFAREGGALDRDDRELQAF
jgi:hypothetical protein